MEENLLQKSLTEFTGVLASASAVPGGGGASALAGALAASLGSMVGALTVGKKKYAAYEANLRSCMERAETLRTELCECINEDAEAFTPLARAYAMPKDAPDRDRILEESLKLAASAPMHILMLCGEVVNLLEVFAEQGSVLAISDAATGAAMCDAAMCGAAINVQVNTRLMKDRLYAERLDDEVRQIIERDRPRAKAVYESVFERLTVK